MLPTKLASEMENMKPTEVEAEAARALAEAFAAYFYDATATGPAVPGSLEGAKAAMLGALTGMSQPGAGPASIQAGIAAFWGVVAGSAASIWSGTLSATPPPTLGAIAAAVTAVAQANTSGKLEKPQAMKTIAAAIHSNNLGGMAVLPSPSPPVPIA